MAYRSNEAAENGYERALQYLVSREMDDEAQERGRKCLDDLVDRFGPVVDGYPTWHPLVVNQDPKRPETVPNERCGYRGLDHTVYFRDGFVTCPYNDGQAVIDSANDIGSGEIASIYAERLEVALYHPGTTPILVFCDWHKPMAMDGTIPASVAVPMILEREVPCWRWADRGEPWESMRPYLLGSPCGSRSSLFINQETGSAIKKVWELLVELEVFGPSKVARF